MSSNKVYWTQRNGVEIDIDKMDIQHLRNTLKMIVRNTNRIKSQPTTSRTFWPNGELAQEDAFKYEMSKYGVCECDIDSEISTVDFCICQCGDTIES